MSLDGGHIHRTVIAAVEAACRDILGKSPGGKIRESVLGYAHGWYRTERTPEHIVRAAEEVVSQGFHALKVDPFGTAQGFIEADELELAYEIINIYADGCERRLGQRSEAAR